MTSVFWFWHQLWYWTLCSCFWLFLKIAFPPLLLSIAYSAKDMFIQPLSFQKNKSIDRCFQMWSKSFHGWKWNHLWIQSQQSKHRNSFGFALKQFSIVSVFLRNLFGSGECHLQQQIWAKFNPRKTDFRLSSLKWITDVRINHCMKSTCSCTLKIKKIQMQRSHH